MSEKNNKKRRKENLLTFDLTVESPEDIIAADKDENRKNAFKEAYKVIANIIPEYFIKQSKKRKNSSSGGTAFSKFSKEIVVTTDKVTVKTKEVTENTKQEVEKEDRERE